MKTRNFALRPDSNSVYRYAMPTNGKYFVCSVIANHDELYFCVAISRRKRDISGGRGISTIRKVGPYTI